jgi:uncharacterized delta-60 repeat protein
VNNPERSKRRARNTLSLRSSHLFLGVVVAATLNACSSQPAPTPKANRLGLVEITFSGIGQDFTASARGVKPNTNGSSFAPQALTDIPDGVQLSLLTRSTFDLGRRGVDGTRFLSATFAVRNATASGTPYPDARKNLTFVGVVTPTTLSETPIRTLEKFDLTSADPALALEIQPTHAMRLDHLARRAAVIDEAADLQVFTEPEIATLGTLPGVTSLLPYGFVARCARNCTAGSRGLRVNPAPDEFDGQVTFAVKLPLQASAKDDPFRFSLLFEVVDDDATRVTRSADETSTAARARAAAIVNSSLVSGNAVCAVRTAGIDPNAPLRVVRDNGLEASGKVVTSFPQRLNAAYAVALQPDGKIVSAGRSFSLTAPRRVDLLLTRHLSNGRTDSSFGNAGSVITRFDAITHFRTSAVVLQPDGKIVVVGEVTRPGTDFGLARYNPDGTLDSSFGQAGLVLTDFDSRSDSATSATLQPDGKIVVAGTSDGDYVVARYNPDGALDSSFGQAGRTITDIAGTDRAYAVALLPDGKIVASGISGNAVSALRLNPDGSLDTTFGTNGSVASTFGMPWFGTNFAMTVQPDEQIVIARTALISGGNTGFALLRLTASGALDTSFGANGVMFTDLLPTGQLGSSQPTAVTVQPDGKIVTAGLVGSSDVQFGLTRHLPNGTPDSSFNGNGKLTLDLGSSFAVPRGVALQPDGKIVVVGESGNGAFVGDAVLIRLWP